MSDLRELREASLRAWRRDTRLPDYPLVTNTSDSHYIPALEAEVDRLRAMVGEPPLVGES